MSSVINTTAVDLTNPAGSSAAVNVLDTAGGTKIAPATVLVDQTGSEVDLATNAQLIAILAQLHQVLSVSVSNFPATQLVSGSVTVSGSVEVANDSGNPLPVSASALPLPSGASTAALQPALNGDGGALTHITNFPSSQTISGSVSVSNLPSSQNVDLYDASGNAINSLSAGAGANGLLIAMGATNFTHSTNNSTTTQLASNATFTGVVESIFNEQAASILVQSDQNGTLTINQWITNGTGIPSAIVFSIVAGVTFNRVFEVGGNYLNLTFKNTGASTTTTLNIDTAYGTMPAVSQLGNNPSAINEIGGVAITTGSLPVTAASLPLPTGAAADSSLQTLITKIPSQGQAAPTASTPVTLSIDVPVATGSYQTVLNTDLLTNTVSGWYDAGNFHSVAIQIIGNTTITAGAIIFEQTNDTTLAPSGVVLAVEEPITVNSTINVAAITIASATVRMFYAQLTARYVRVRISTAFTGATTGVQATAIFSQMPYNRMTQLVYQPTSANLNVVNSNAAGTNAIGDVGIAYRTTISNSAVSASALSPATPAATTIKSSSGRLVGWQLQNSASAVRSVKIFNTAAPTLGTTAAFFEIDIPANGQAQFQMDGGIGFSTAIVYSVTAAKGLTDNTSTGLAANDVSGAFFYA